MKSATVAFGMFAAMANAAAYPRIYARNANTTEIAEPGTQTTLTVIATNLETIISCKPTVTNCPAKQTDIDQLPESEKEPAVVTHTVVLATTICPVEEAAKVSSSVKKDHDNGIITGSTISISTTHIEPEVPVKTGTPESPKEGGENSGQTPEEENPEEEEQTTTTTATSTSTKYTTVFPNMPTATDGENSPEKGDGNGTPSNGKGEGNGNGNGNGNEECVPETVTVTAAASTVYVTVGDAGQTKGSSPKPTNGGDNSPSEGDDEIPEDCIPEDEDEDDEEGTTPVTEQPAKGGENSPSKDYPAGGKPKGDKPSKGGENSPANPEDCDDEEDDNVQIPSKSSAVPSSAAPSATMIVPPPVDTPVATPSIPGNDSGEIVTTSIMPGSAQPTGFYRMRR